MRAERRRPIKVNQPDWNRSCRADIHAALPYLFLIGRLNVSLRHESQRRVRCLFSVAGVIVVLLSRSWHRIDLDGHENNNNWPRPKQKWKVFTWPQTESTSQHALKEADDDELEIQYAPSCPSAPKHTNKRRKPSADSLRDRRRNSTTTKPQRTKETSIKFK